MGFDINQFVQELEFDLNVFDLNSACLRCDRLIEFLAQSNESIPLATAEKILQRLRNKRMFAVMQKIADTLLQTGRISYKIQRQYAQSLIDSGNFTAAVYILQNLIASTSSTLPSDGVASSENAEAKGLMGRIYKQLYVNTKDASNPKCIEYITIAVNSYYGVYSINNTKNWHGINTVALLERAKRDKIQLSVSKDSLQLAEEILKNIQIKYDSKKADAWDFATAAEACLALNRPKEATQWLSGYARMPDCDAFELSSTLRQLEEVWQLDLSSEMGQYLLPILRSELMRRKGSDVTIDIAEIRKQQSIESVVDANYDSLIENRIVVDGTPGIKLEKTFGPDSYKTYKWYMQGADRCLSVARIGKDSTQGFGTGFLLRGKDLSAGFAEEFVLLTNSHVVSTDPAEKSLRPEEAIVIFEALDSSQEFRDFEIIWSSSRDKLDASVLRFSATDHDRLMRLTESQKLKFYPVSKYLPVLDTPPTQKVYVIGHPNGGTLQISFQDNLLIDHDKISKIHYRTPTDGGSSGSPVFNQQWDLIGLHHAGGDEVPCLNGKPGAYQANEGIWIQSIIKELVLVTLPARR